MDHDYVNEQLKQFKMHRKNVLLTIFLLLTTGLFGMRALESILYLISYPTHQGYNERVLGWPTPFQHSLFYVLFWTIGFVGSFLLLLFRRSGWYLSQITAIPGVLFLLAVVIMSLFTPLGYFNAKHILLLFWGCGFIVILNSKTLKALVSSDGNVPSIRIIVIGVIIIAVVATLLFDVFSLY